MLSRAMKYIAIIYFFIVAFFAWFSQAKTQTYIYNQARAVDVQDALHRNLENIALDEMTVNIDENLRKENITVIKDVSIVKKEIKERFYDYLENHTDIKVTEYKDNIYSDSKIKGTYTKTTNQVVQSESQLPAIALDVSGVYYNTLQNIGRDILETPFNFKVTVDLDFVEVTTTKDERQENTTNKVDDKSNFTVYKNNQYFKEGNDFNSSGIITKGGD